MKVLASKAPAKQASLSSTNLTTVPAISSTASSVPTMSSSNDGM